jgi:stage III sporulation protein AE
VKRYLFLIPLLFALLASPVKATAPEEVLGNLFVSLPEEVRDALPKEVEEGLLAGDPASVKKLDASFLFDYVGTSLEAAAARAVAPLTALLLSLFLAALLRATSDGVGDAAGKAITFASGFSVLIAVLRTVKPAWELASGAISDIGLLAKCTLPATAALCAATGSVSSSTVNATWLTALLVLIEHLSETALMPLFGIAFGFLALSLFSRLSGVGNTAGIFSSIKGGFTLLLTLLGTVLTVVMTYQSVLAQSADTVLLRSVKFASGNLIPVVGGALSETASSYLSSIALLRSSAGVLAAVALLLFVLPPILQLLLLRLALLVSSAIAGVFGCAEEGDMIREAVSLLDLALAMLSILSALFLILAGVFATTAVSV